MILEVFFNLNNSVILWFYMYSMYITIVMFTALWQYKLYWKIPHKRWWNICILFIRRSYLLYYSWSFWFSLVFFNGLYNEAETVFQHIAMVGLVVVEHFNGSYQCITIVISFGISYKLQTCESSEFRVIIMCFEIKQLFPISYKIVYNDDENDCHFFRWAERGSSYGIQTHTLGLKRLQVYLEPLFKYCVDCALKSSYSEYQNFIY